MGEPGADWQAAAELLFTAPSGFWMHHPAWADGNPPAPTAAVQNGRTEYEAAVRDIATWNRYGVGRGSTHFTDSPSLLGLIASLLSNPQHLMGRFAPANVQAGFEMLFSWGTGYDLLGLPGSWGQAVAELDPETRASLFAALVGWYPATSGTEYQGAVHGLWEESWGNWGDDELPALETLLAMGEAPANKRALDTAIDILDHLSKDEESAGWSEKPASAVLENWSRNHPTHKYAASWIANRS